MSSSEELEIDATIPYHMEEDGVPPRTETPPAAPAPAPEDRPPAPPKSRKRRRRRKKGGMGHWEPKEEAIRLLPLHHHLLLAGGTIGK